MSMNIALDYDDTFSLNPELWRDFVRLFKKFNNDVRIVTARGEAGKKYPTFYGGEVAVHEKNNVDIEKAIEGLDIQVIYCGWEQKQKVCNDLGFIVDVWVDDSPETIVIR